MLESAKTLLRVSQSEVKMEKLRNTVVTHENNIERLTNLIAGINGNHVTSSYCGL